MELSTPEGTGNVGDDEQRLADELPPRDPDDLETEVSQCHVAPAVSLEGGAMTVKSEAVDLHDHAGVWP